LLPTSTHVPCTVLPNIDKNNTHIYIYLFFPVHVLYINSAMESAKNEEPLVAELLRRHAELQQDAVSTSMESNAQLATNTGAAASRRPSGASSEEGGGIGGFFSRFAKPDNAPVSGGSYPSSMNL
jgi:hypothetical protein